MDVGIKAKLTRERLPCGVFQVGAAPLDLELPLVFLCSGCTQLLLEDLPHSKIAVAEIGGEALRDSSQYGVGVNQAAPLGSK